MSDLVELNKRIVSHVMGRRTTPEEDRYITLLGVCVGQFIPQIDELKRLLFGKKPDVNQLPVVYINRDYLNFARLACKDVLAGRYEKLVELNIDMNMAVYLAALTNDEVTRLAACWTGVVIKFDDKAFKSGTELHSSAAKYHAAAYAAATV